MYSENLFDIFVDPATKEPLAIKEKKELDGINTIRYLQSSCGVYPIKNGIPYIMYPAQLPEPDKASQNFYEGRAQQYEDNLHLTFLTHRISEVDARNSFIDKLCLKPSSRVLEIACGTGRDSELIANRLHESGELHLQDISIDMMRLCHSKLSQNKVVRSFSVSNAMYLPYPSNYFDAIYSFGALGEFSDIQLALREITRVARVGAKVVVGDESIPTWLRNTNFFHILKETNPMFAADLPLSHLPVEARDTEIKFVIGQTFYLISFTVGEGEPSANFDFEIPGVRGGTYRTRFEGKLEGVTPEAKKLAKTAAIKNGESLHSWLDRVVRNAAVVDLKD